MQENGTWNTVASGQVIGQRNLLQIPSTTGQNIALVIDQANAVPAISEFALYQAP